ncbi:MAG: GDSL-type esterase/lipase family protein [Humidesulfovibrio sp.]|uniref:GDSL-type esterase/lipase family protein n=1 Tax=Humidesulfovibrio sp. TaxID=2910988 RepID=UPI0027EAEFDF|nr:GDSL-type esterase/lipase family protein [Humidesulfovibrio sp.]MDQ7834121.1 GDSL-type esterase/lipase family protein [Humidesulfovibrio sp.]
MVICFVGDSTVQGIGDAQALGWVGRLAQASFALAPNRATALTLCNLGLRGDSSVRVAARWQEETARRTRPGEDMAFVFSFGAADRPQQVPVQDAASSVKRMLREAASLGRTVFIAPPPSSDPAWAARNRELGLALLAVCDELGVPGYDLFTPLSASKGYMDALAAGDAIHPDAGGYAEIAGLLAAWPPLADLLGL